MAMTIALTMLARCWHCRDSASHAAELKLEKEQLKLGFIKLTDMAPLAIAYEKGFFEDEGLYVTLEPQANWKVILDRVITGELDGAHMLAGQPLGATIGFGTKADMVTAYSMDLNGKAITVSNEVWSAMQAARADRCAGQGRASDQGRRAEAGRRVVQGAGQAIQDGDGVPGLDAQLRAALLARRRRPASGLLFAERCQRPDQGRCAAVGDTAAADAGDARSRNDQRLLRRRAVESAGDLQEASACRSSPTSISGRTIPDKVFGVTKAWAEKNPNTHLAVAEGADPRGMWLDANNGANRKEAAQILSRSEYVGADYRVIANSMTGTFEFGKGDERKLPDFNVFFRYYATYPYYSDAVWYLTQMRRWGQIAEAKPDQWYQETAKKVYRPDLYLKAAQLLIARRQGEEGRLSLRQRRLSRGDQGVHRRHRVRRPQAERVSREVRDRPEGRAEGRRRQRGRQVSEHDP